MALEYKFVPLQTWSAKATLVRERSRFETPWAKTQDELHRELRQLQYRIGSVELHTFHSGSDVRNDGQLRAQVRMPSHPGVIVKFNRYDGKTGKIIAMQFACDRFLQWKDNVLAIARAMAALRMVDRYGVSSGRGEASQYEGFRQQLPPAISLNGMNPDEAAMLLSRYANNSAVSWESIRDQPSDFDAIRRAASMKAHPDRGGSHEDMAKVNLAVETLRRHFTKAA